MSRLAHAEFGRESPEGEPLPGDVGYEAYQVYLGQKDAYWSAVARGEISVDHGEPGRSAARTDADLLEAAVRAERAVAAAEGAKLRAIADLALRRMAQPTVGLDADQMQHSVQAEVGLWLRISPSEASELTRLAVYLAQRLPTTFAALEDGAISLARVKVLVQESLHLSPAQCAELESAVLGEEGPLTLRAFRDRVRREVEKLDADAVRKRREAARARRCLYVRDDGDGMATLCLHVPIDQARAIYDIVNSRIPAHAGAGDDRRIGARRADHLLRVLEAGLGTDLHAVVPPAGVVLTAEQIERLDRGADSYVPSAAMKAAIRARDVHCRFPGCCRPAVHCDVDHTVPFRAGGRTVYTNLGAICRFHHQVKQTPGWHVTQDGDATFTWTSPTGRVVTTRPPPASDEHPVQD